MKKFIQNIVFAITDIILVLTNGDELIFNKSAKTATFKLHFGPKCMFVIKRNIANISDAIELMYQKRKQIVLTLVHAIGLILDDINKGHYPCVDSYETIPDKKLAKLSTRTYDGRMYASIGVKKSPHAKNQVTMYIKIYDKNDGDASSIYSTYSLEESSVADVLHDMTREILASNSKAMDIFGWRWLPDVVATIKDLDNKKIVA